VLYPVSVTVAAAVVSIPYRVGGQVASVLPLV